MGPPITGDVSSMNISPTVPTLAATVKIRVMTADMGFGTEETHQFAAIDAAQERIVVNVAAVRDRFSASERLQNALQPSPKCRPVEGH